MLDHVFTDAIGALRDALEAAFLERQALEERFQVDVLLGDINWETSYGLPGEGTPPRVRADLALEWPTWAQTAYRSWYLEEEITEPPHIEIEINFRVQGLAGPPDLPAVAAAMPMSSTMIGEERLERSGLAVEHAHDAELTESEYSIEVTYGGTYELREAILADGSRLDEDFAAMGGWVASTLVRLGDLRFDFVEDRRSE